MPNVTIYHNPKCSKSRQTLQLLRDHGGEPTIIEYLKTPPTRQVLSNLLKMLNFKPRQLMRTKESTYRENNLGDENLTNTQLIDAMVKHPILIERPIVVANNKAVIGRPSENVREIL